MRRAHHPLQRGDSAADGSGSRSDQGGPVGSESGRQSRSGGSWVPLDIMVPAVIIEPEQVADAFQGWIVAHGSMAPEDGAAAE